MCAHSRGRFLAAGTATVLAFLITPLRPVAAVLDFEAGYTGAASVVGQPADRAAPWARFTANTAADASLVVATRPAPAGRLLRAINSGAAGGFRLPLQSEDYIAGGGFTFDGAATYARYRFILTYDSVSATANGNAVGLIRLGDTNAQSLSVELIADGRLRYQTYDATGATLRNVFVKAATGTGAADFKATAGQPILVEGILDYGTKHYTLVVNGVPQPAYNTTADWRIAFRSPAATDNDLLVNTQGVGQAYFQPWTFDDLELTAEPTPATAAHLAGVTINVVTAYGADPTGATDSTTALQTAISENIGRSAGVRTLYFPNGTYLVSDTLQWFNLADQNDTYLTLQGESRDGVVIRLTDQNPAFQNPTPDPSARKAVLHVRSDHNPAWYANPSNPYGEALGEGHLAFHNNLINLTIDTGTGNPGAVGLDYHVSNQGVLRDVVIRSGDGQGLIGLALDRKNTGPGLVTGVRIQGFTTGIWARSQYVLTLEHIHLEGQSLVGLLNEGHTLAVRGLRSLNSSPALVSTSAEGLIVLLDAELRGGDPADYALELNAGRLLARNVLTSGYAGALVHQGTAFATPYLADFSSAPAAPLHPGAVALRLPVEETPRPPALPLADYALVTDHGATPGDGLDDTAALQAAFDAGRPGVLFAPGSYTLTAPLTVPAHVRHIDFNWANLQATAGTGFPARGPTPAALQVNASAPHPLILEKFTLRGTGFDLFAAGVAHTSSRPLVVQHALFPAFRNGPDAGPLFLTDTTSHENGESFSFDYPQRVWLRQFNPEPYYHAKAVNNGGDLWIFGMKTERASTALRTLGGGRTELLGAVFYQNHEPPAHLPLIEAIDADHTLTFNTTTDFQGVPFNVALRETRAADTADLLRTAAPIRGGAANGVALVRHPGARATSDNPDRLPRVRLELPSPTVAEGTAATVRVRRTGDLASAITVQLTLGGTATPGADFTTPATSITLPTGAATIDVTLATLADPTVETAETIILSVAPGTGYVAGYPATAVLTLRDDDAPMPLVVTGPGPLLWFRADGDLALDSDGRVTTWFDHSGAGNHAALTVAHRTPLWLPTEGVERPAPALRFADSMLFLPKSDSLQNAGPYPGRSYFLAFKTGADVTRRQMIYEQGGSGRGLTIYVVDGRVYACAYNRIQVTALWNEVFRSAPVQPHTRYVLEVHLDGTTATFNAVLNRLDLGTIAIPGTNGGVLDTHGDLTVLGGVTESARFHDLDVPRRLGGYYFDGLVYEMIGYNGALAPQPRTAVGAYLADRYLGPPPPPNAAPTIRSWSPMANPTYLTGGGFPRTLAVSVQATDDGRPAPGALTYTWQPTRAPLATFTHANAATTTATFTRAGIYRFKCVVSDGERTAEQAFVVVVQ